MSKPFYLPSFTLPFTLSSEQYYGTNPCVRMFLEVYGADQRIPVHAAHDDAIAEIRQNVQESIVHAETTHAPLLQGTGNMIIAIGISIDN